MTTWEDMERANQAAQELDDLLCEKGVIMGDGTSLRKDGNTWMIEVSISKETDKLILPFLPQEYNGYRLTYKYGTRGKFA
ncbi:hypothetical protein A2303_04510 [Candidatus Falkowbacteria bacterium RIFOXYB2_FULL_47_14]|uniref:Uncharacterized protein n=1 Tax=Candidatus Falkowbacteria bacterium RIFOXYA2_FULL_47_19 TaxID=1797994 RepID=A0A1F5SL59_9BACT|nr:MAG: hypothetical protein A2227_02345 [Candidatus Falkowbacteria bacterium RIFOXYA2_FULL_47_19]OGF36527.1 MAG: hypothetical protein A2468_05530 [Candidatus Falkowbacteria bacterium RIFOXYC2_FULL_46_15]OGF42808.1 MAG: hypothetical protein A2303_04510 [Candidatus Falkowbacteria bacterium RIFOXYB2_FULL_47_14]